MRLFLPLWYKQGRRLPVSLQRNCLSTSPPDKVTTTASPTTTAINSDPPTTTSATTKENEALTSVSLGTTTETALSKLSSLLTQATAFWQERSGTAEVLTLKDQVSERSLEFDAATLRVDKTRKELDESMVLWEQTSGQHWQLLQRRDRWTPDDAKQVASLVSEEVDSRTAMEQGRVELAQAEKDLRRCQMDYMNALRKRYHEEQMWQDQWRVLGTYGTWSLIMLNSCVFMASQFFHHRREAHKMKRLESLVLQGQEQQQQVHEQQMQFQASAALAPTPPPALEDSKEKEATTETTEKEEPSPASAIIATEKEERDEAEEKTSEPTSPSPTSETSKEDGPLEQLLSSEWVQQIRSSEWYQDTSRKCSELAEDIHVPSALLGASVTGVAAIAVGLAMASSRSR